MEAKKTISVPIPFVIHLPFDPNVELKKSQTLAAVKRYYNLFPGATLTQLIVGKDRQPCSGLSLPVTSGKDAFPDQKILDCMQEKLADIHFAVLDINGNALQLGSAQYTPTGCSIPGAGPGVAEVIPEITLPGAKQAYQRASQPGSGFQPCSGWNEEFKNGYILDSGGFLVLFQEPTGPSA